MPKIILVEDDPMISEIYQKKFSDSGFEVFSAESGEQALNIARKEQIDVVISDLMMPKMDGFEVIRNLRGGEYDAKIKIIISSNLSQKEDRDKAMQLGANGFIAKSEFSPTELVQEVKRILGQFSEQEKNLNRSENSADEVNKTGAPKILIIEDEEIFIEMFGDKLKQEGFVVSFARNGAWGVKEAMKDDFDLFIIDMVMPAMTGEEMVAKLKMEDRTKNVPIIVLSASVEDEVARRVEAMGVQAFFVKTQITPSEVVSKVKELLK
ncbi:MAG: response regulator [Parcubacteria group bacterium]|jgi:DNA-binding response OmpR family regulator